MPFLSFLLAIKYFGHFQNPYTLVVDIHLLSAVDFAMGIGRCMNDDLLNELMQDTGCQLRDIGCNCNEGKRKAGRSAMTSGINSRRTSQHAHPDHPYRHYEY